MLLQFTTMTASLLNSRLLCYYKSISRQVYYKSVIRQLLQITTKHTFVLNSEQFTNFKMVAISFLKPYSNVFPFALGKKNTSDED